MNRDLGFVGGPSPLFYISFRKLPDAVRTYEELYGSEFTRVNIKLYTSNFLTSGSIAGYPRIYHIIICL